MVKTAVPLLYLLDLLMKKSADNQPLTKSEVQSSTVWCTDVYQFLQVVYTDITSRRRTVIKGEIQPKYKGLCDETVPVTDFLIGNDIQEKLKEFDAESEMAQKITGKQMKIRHGRGKKRKHDQDKHEGKGRGQFFRKNRDHKFDDMTSRKHGNGDFFNARQTFQEKEEAEPKPEPKLKNEHFNQNSHSVHTVNTYSIVADDSFVKFSKYSRQFCRGENIPLFRSMAKTHI